MTSPDIAELRQKYQAAGQGHVFTFWDSLNPQEQAQLAQQLIQIDPVQVSEIANSTIVNKAPQEHKEPKIEGLPSDSTASIVDSNPRAADWYQQGLKLIADNQVGVVLLAGGQGTRLGSSAPKGCYDVGLPSKSTLFQIQAERIKKISQLAAAAYPSSSAGAGAAAAAAAAAVSIPWYIMTSGPTRKHTEDFFRENNYFGLDHKDITFFEQGVLPCLTADGKIIMESKNKVAVAPDGNGGVYNALNKNGILADIKARGIKHIHTYCVDNCLVKIADPVFLGYAAERNLQIATKVVRKRDATESVGLIVSKDGSPAVIEYSEITKELASETTPDGLLRLRAANIVNHYYSANFLLAIPTWKSSYLPFHIAHKKIPYVDIKTGEATKPAEPNGYKLEQFVFDVFPSLQFSQFGCLEVDRSAEFSPLKNGPGTENDNPETSLRDLLTQSHKWLTNAGAVIAEGHHVEVSPLTSYGGEGLSAFSGKSITSDVV